jgi:hypothetical protein
MLDENPTAEGRGELPKLPRHTIGARGYPLSLRIRNLTQHWRGSIRPRSRRPPNRSPLRSHDRNRGKRWRRCRTGDLSAQNGCLRRWLPVPLGVGNNPSVRFVSLTVLGQAGRASQGCNVVALPNVDRTHIAPMIRCQCFHLFPMLMMEGTMMLTTLPGSGGGG